MEVSREKFELLSRELCGECMSGRELSELFQERGLLLLDAKKWERVKEHFEKLPVKNCLSLIEWVRELKKEI